SRCRSRAPFCRHRPPATRPRSWPPGAGAVQPEPEPDAGAGALFTMPIPSIPPSHSDMAAGVDSRSMPCPPLEEIAAGQHTPHVAVCAECRAIVEVAKTGHAHDACGTAEALMVAHAAGALAPSAQKRLIEHLERCTGCMRLARELEGSEV